MQREKNAPALLCFAILLSAVALLKLACQFSFAKVDPKKMPAGPTDGPPPHNVA